MTDKLKKNQDMNMPMEDESAAELKQDAEFNQEEQDFYDVNAKGGQTSDEGLGEYEVGYFESTEVMDDDDADAWGESSTSKNSDQSSDMK